MTSEATSDLEFELLDFDNLCSHVSVASKCHNLQTVGMYRMDHVLLTKVKHRTSFIPRIVAE